MVERWQWKGKQSKYKGTVAIVEGQVLAQVVFVLFGFGLFDLHCVGIYV